jgi:hypothetical protein
MSAHAFGVEPPPCGWCGDTVWMRAVVTFDGAADPDDGRWAAYFRCTKCLGESPLGRGNDQITALHRAHYEAVSRLNKIKFLVSNEGSPEALRLKSMTMELQNAVAEIARLRGEA